jgi:hypothetical protein
VRFQQKQQANCAPGSSASDYSAAGAMIAYRRCVFEDDLELTGTGTIDLSSCSFFGGSLFVTGPRVDLAGVLMMENEAAYIDGGSRLSVSVPCVAQDWHWWVSQGQFRLDANLMHYFFDSTPSIAILNGGELVFGTTAAGTLSGNDTTAGSIVTVSAGGRIFYPPSTTLAALCTITNSGTDLNTNGTTRTFASIPAAGFSLPNDDVVIGPNIAYNENTYKLA